MPHTCEEARAKALAGYLDPGPGHLNCAQAVFLFGLLVMDQDAQAIGLASYMGGGIARMGQTCGALSGAALTLGLRKQIGLEEGSKDPNQTFEFLQRLFGDFEAKFGSATCKGLLGCDISSSAGFRQAKKSQALARCPDFVSWTIERLAQVLCVG